MYFHELRQKEVVNVRDGMRLGFVEDLTLNPKDGCICNVIVPCDNRILGVWGKERQYVIEWCKVVRIGCDIILVDVEPAQCCQDPNHRGKNLR